MHAVRNGQQLLTFRCPGTSSPAVCRIRFSIASLRCRLLWFYHGWHGKQKSVTVQCKARQYYESPSRQQKNEGEKNFPRFARRDHHYTLLYTAFVSGRTTPKYLAPALLASYQSVATRIVYVTNALITGSGRGDLKTFGCASCAHSWTPLSKFLDPPLITNFMQLLYSSQSITSHTITTWWFTRMSC